MPSLHAIYKTLQVIVVNQIEQYNNRLEIKLFQQSYQAKTTKKITALIEQRDTATLNAKELNISINNLKQETTRIKQDFDKQLAIKTTAMSNQQKEMQLKLEEVQQRADEIIKAKDNIAAINEMHEVFEKSVKFIKDVVHADRATLFIVDESNEELYSRVTDVGKEIRISMHQGICGYVATSCEVLNIPDAYSNELFDSSYDQLSGYRTKQILTIPVINKSKLIEKERREVVRLRTEANELRNEASKLHRKNEELVENKAAMLHLANSQKEEVTRMEETYKERVSMLQSKIYSLKRSNKETEINVERKNIELKSTREDLHHSNLRYQELTLTRQEDVKKLTLDIEETKEMLEDKKNQVEVLSNSVNALQDDKNHLVRKLQHLEGQLRVANDEIDTVQTSSQMKISELQRSLVDVTKESERYRSKHQDLKRLMLREASEVVAERFVANKFDNKKFENAMEQSFDKL
eukprot:g4678.t1